MLERYPAKDAVGLELVLADLKLIREDGDGRGEQLACALQRVCHGIAVDATAKDRLAKWMVSERRAVAVKE